MFRELTRKNKQISNAECIRILTEEKRGVLSVQGEDGYPYGSPMNHFYSAEDGCIYFHCGKVGHRLEAVKRCGKVSFCTWQEAGQEEGGWAALVKSVIVFGRMEIIGDAAAIADVTARLSRKFTLDEAYIQEEIRQHGPATLLLKLTPEHICGKLVTEK